VNFNLPKIKARLPKLPRDFSRRDVLSLVGALVVLFAIPLTVILFRRYQETRIKAFDAAQIVEGSVKITNLHAHGFTVSWATAGDSGGHVIWGPADGGLTERSDDDRGGSTLSSTHHVTLPFPPGDDSESAYFQNPIEAYDFKMVSGGGTKVYGGEYRSDFFDVINVTEDALAVRVTTGPELAGSGNESYSAYGAYVYIDDSDRNYLTQSLYDANGQDSWYRTCPIGPDGAEWGSCSEWVWVDLRNTRGVGNESYSAYGAYVDDDRGILRQSLVDANDQDSWWRECLIGSDGVEWDSCDDPTYWREVDLRNERRTGGNESYSAYGAYTYTDSSGTHLTQSLHDTNGQDAWSRTCPVGPDGAEWGNCGEWGWIDLRNIRGVGNESYSAYGAYVDSVGEYLYQAFIDTNGQDSWQRKCLIGQDGVEWDSCDDPVFWQKIDLRNERRTGGEPDPVYGNVEKSSGVAAPGTIVYTTVRDSGGASSAPLSTVTNNEGRYVTDLGNARTADRNEYFSYDRNSTEYFEDIFAQGGTDGVAEKIGNPTNDDQPIETLTLNHPPVISPIDTHNVTEGVAYSYPVEASDADGDALTYRLGSAPDDACGNEPVNTSDYCYAENVTRGCTYEGDPSFCSPPDEEWFSQTCVWDPVFCPGPPDTRRWRCTTTTYCQNDPTPSGMTIDENGLITWANPTPVGGVFPITVWVGDGKSFATEAYTLTVVEAADEIAPETEIISGPADGETITTDSVTFTYTGTDNVTATGNLVYSYKLDEGTWSSWSSTTEATVTVDAGEHTFYVKAKDTAGNADETPAQRSFNVSLVSFDRVEITPTNKTLEVGQTQNFTATAYDSDDNPITAEVTYVWTVLEGIGAVDPDDQQTTTFTATTINNGSIKVIAAVDGTSVPAQVPVSVVAALNCATSSINPPTFDVAPSEEQVLIANPIGGTGMFTYAWSATGGSFTNGTTTQTTTWQAPATAQDGNTFTISVAITDDVTGTSCPALQAVATISIPSPALHHVDITPPSAQIHVLEPLGFTAQAYDSAGNPIAEGVNYTWSVSNPLNEFSPTTGPTTTFTGHQVGSSFITVVAILGENTISKNAPITLYSPILCDGSRLSPKSFDITPGGTQTLTVTPLWGSGQYGYSWDKTGGSFVGSTDTAVVQWEAPSNATNGQTFDITVVISDAVTGRACVAERATATVYTALSCTVSPNTFTIAPSGSKNLSVTTSGGSNNKSIVWAKSGGDFVGATNAANVEWKASASATNGQTFNITATVTDNVTASTCAGTSTATISVTAEETTLNISLSMQGRPSYPSDSRGSAGIADLYVREGSGDKVLIADDLTVAGDGTATNIALSGLSVGPTYDFLLKGYIHLTTLKEKVLEEGINSINFGKLLAGDINTTRDDQVNSIDNDVFLTQVVNSWNSAQPCPDNALECRLGDFNLDSMVNSIDYDIIFSNWGETGNE